MISMTTTTVVVVTGVSDGEGKQCKQDGMCKGYGRFGDVDTL